MERQTQTDARSDRQPLDALRESPRPAVPGLPTRIREAMEPLPDIDDEQFAAAFDRYADCRVVLLGEASHGTSEFYRARAAITKRLVEKHGFRIVAAEADWPDASVIDRYVRHRGPRADGEPPFSRFPQWMWRNQEVAELWEWMRRYNEQLPMRERAGFYGLDLYSMDSSIRAVIDYLEGVDPELSEVARERYSCLTPWSRDPAQYGLVALTHGHEQCEHAVLEMLRELLEKRLEYAKRDGAEYFDATQNARVIRDAETYYRAMYEGSAESWNVRDSHMFATLLQVMRAEGETAKAVVWAHNSHIGDARFTEMGTARGELNLGQLCRQHFGSEAALIGFGTHTGTVAAAHNWDSPMQVMDVKPSLPGSVERLFVDAGLPRGVLHLRDLEAELGLELHEPRIERFIGVIYRPETERMSHYADVALEQQFDAYTWFEETRALQPLDGPGKRGGVPDTFPFGL